MGIEVLTAVGLLSTAASAGIGVANYLAQEDAARAQKNLTDQQAAHLEADQKARAAAAAKAASTGMSFGREDSDSPALKTGFGFGTAPQVSPNTGRGQITGMG